jgi:AbiV family abortive infection protein
VTPQFILQGYAYAMEQCGLLLRDANLLYRSGSYASAVVLTAFAREELGRSTIFRDFWIRASAGEAFTVEQLQEACDDHVTKQRAGMLSITMTADRDSGLGKILSVSHSSPEWKQARAEIQRLDEIKTKRTPDDRHEKRKAALYVEPISEHAWNRPGVTSASNAYEFLRDAGNDYSLRTDKTNLKEGFPDLYNALAAWPDCPKFEPPPNVGLPPAPASTATAPAIIALLAGLFWLGLP